jgi:hypothetical protein
VKLAAVFGEVGGDFGADEGVREGGDFEAALDGVVVCDGYGVHAAPASEVVEIDGAGIALGTAEFLQNPVGRTAGEGRMNVQIDLHAKLL